MKIILKNEYTLQRQMPENFFEKHRKHFDEDFNVVIKESHVVEFNKAIIFQLYLFTKWKIQNSYCLTRKLTFKKVIKTYVKRIVFAEREISEGLWVLDQWSFGYFHWLTEVLPRIILAEKAGDKSPILLPKNYRNINYISESLVVFKRTTILYSLKEKLFVNKLIAPSHLEPAQYDSEQIKGVRDRFKEFDNLNSFVKPYRKIYISRSRSNRRFIINESELQDLLHQNGFITVFMEDFPFFEQRKLMSETLVLVSNHGAGLTNMIFMPEKSVIIELKSNSDDINNCFYNLSFALGHIYYYTINNGNSSDVQKASIEVDLVALKEVLKDM